MPVKSILKPEIKKWFEKSAASELYASNLYKFTANQMQRLGLFGFQKYFLKESSEELNHYQSLVDFVNDMGDVLGTPAVEKIDENLSDVGKALLIAYEFEVDLMNQYVEFYKKAEQADDCITATFLLDFMNIQRKSVGEYGDIIARYELNKSDLLEMDEWISEK